MRVGWLTFGYIGCEGFEADEVAFSSSSFTHYDSLFPVSFSLWPFFLFFFSNERRGHYPHAGGAAFHQFDSTDSNRNFYTHSYHSFLPSKVSGCFFFLAFHFDSAFVLPLRSYTFFLSFFSVLPNVIIHTTHSSGCPNATLCKTSSSRRGRDNVRKQHRIQLRLLNRLLNTYI